MIILEGKLFQLFLWHVEQVQNDVIVLNCTVSEVEEVLSTLNEQTATPAQRLNKLRDLTLSDLAWLSLMESCQRLTCRHRYVVSCEHSTTPVKAECEIAQ